MPFMGSGCPPGHFVAEGQPAGVFNPSATRAPQPPRPPTPPAPAPPPPAPAAPPRATPPAPPRAPPGSRSPCRRRRAHPNPPPPQSSPSRGPIVAATVRHPRECQGHRSCGKAAHGLVRNERCHRCRAVARLTLAAARVARRRTAPAGRGGGRCGAMVGHTGTRRTAPAHQPRSHRSYRGVSSSFSGSVGSSSSSSPACP